MNPYVIVNDLDDTTFSYDKHFQKYLREFGHPAGLLGKPDHYSMILRGWFETREEFLELHHRAVVAGMFATIPAIPGAAEAIKRLRDRGAYVKIATHRKITSSPELEEETTLEGLERAGIEFDEIHFVGDKGSVPGDIYVDDAPHVIEALDSAGLNRLVFDRTYNRHIAGPRAIGWRNVEHKINHFMDAALVAS